jgi:hypothetical protein
MYRFINGLRPALQALVYTTMPTTLQEVVEAADYFEHENMVDIEPKQAPASREQDLRTHIGNLQSGVHQLQNYFAQRKTYTCSTYLNQEDETIEEDKMANLQLALDSIQAKLDVHAKHLNMDQPLTLTPVHHCMTHFQSTRRKDLMASWSRTTSLLGWRKRNQARATWHTTCRAQKLMGHLCPSLMTFMVANKRRATLSTMARSPAK